MYKKYLQFFLIIFAFTICIYNIILASSIHSPPRTIFKKQPAASKVSDVQYTTDQSEENDKTKNYIEEVNSSDGMVSSITNEKTKIVQTNASYWDWVDSLVSSHGMYRETDDVEHVLQTMRTSQVTSFTRFKNGSSLKFWVVLSGGQQCIFKPYTKIGKPRGIKGVTHCEIATFYVDRLLGMRKVPYATGRVLNFLTEILPVASKAAADLFSIRANGTVCLRKHGRSFCYDHGVSGALIYFVRREVKVEWGRYHPLHPWGTLNRMVRRNNKSLCTAALHTIPNHIDTIYMDLHDLNILDYLILNLDRQYFHVVQRYPPKEHVVTLHLDHDLAQLCRMENASERYNYVVLLSPLRQCCRIRRATYDRLVDIYNLGDSFPEKFDNLTRHDPLFPLVNRKSMAEMVDRVGHVIDLVNTTCRPLVTNSDFFV